MKYLLSKKEYLSLVYKAELGDTKISNEELQVLCTMVANKLPITYSWKFDKTPEPWGCILSTEEEHYCDECPVQKYCPHPTKSYSK